MKLRNKLVIAQLCVFLVIMGILLMALPELVYRNISVKDREDTMILNEQIMSQLDQNFEELVRFTKIVAEEPELIQKIDQYMSEPNEANNAKISLFLSQLGVKNKIQSYGIIGIYLDVQKADKIYDFSTVGFSNKVKEHICSEIKELDLIIIGAGPAGLTSAIYASRAKLSTLVLEDNLVGGQVRSEERR